MNRLIARTLLLLAPTLTGLQAQAADSWQEHANADGTIAAGFQAHKTVWTGSEMIVWGGLQTPPSVASKFGARYNPAKDKWTAMNTTGAPAPRTSHTAVWTGSELIVWGGAEDNTRSTNTGGRYDPEADRWTATTTTGAPSARYFHTAVWTGSEMIVWGGVGGGNTFATGGRYNPATDSWTALSTTNAPARRESHSAVWAGGRMIVWGGIQEAGVYSNSGGRYEPITNSWTATTTTGAPAPRHRHTAVWTESEMIIWGGNNASAASINTGGRYNSATDSWTTMTSTAAPSGRMEHGVVWTGREMIVWGGQINGTYVGLNTGGRYSPAENRWAPVTSTGAPRGRFRHSAVWTGREMLLWGGIGGGVFSDTFSYTPDCEAFRITSNILEGGNLTVSFPTITGLTYTLWQSDTLSDDTWTDTGLTALSGTGKTLTFTVSAGLPGNRFFRVKAAAQP